MASAFQTPKRPYPGQFATPASVAAPREDPYRQNVMYPNLNDLPRELGTPSRTYSYGGHQASEPVPYRPQNALVQRQSASGVVAAHDRLQPSTEPLDPKQRGARSISQALEAEAKYPALDDIIGQGQSGEYELAQSYAPEPFIRSAQHVIPDSIFEQYNLATSHTLMGLFPDLKQAWITVDNRLYLWDYASGSGFQGYEAQPNNITAVKLLKPKPGVFVSQVTYVLVIATSVDVFLLGVEVQENQRGSVDVVLYETKMSVPTKAQDVTIIEGSKTTGRIFFASKADNDVYEFTYQAEERWFHGRCGKVCHTNGGMSTVLPRISWFSDHKDSETVEQIVIDDTRSLLYTLSSASTIRVFQMKPDGALNLCITHAFANTLANVRVMSNSSNIGPESPIVAISPVIAPQARRTHLVAITKSGCRLFMNAVSSGYDFGTDSPPTSMQVVHIRHPPSGAPIRNNVRRAKVFTPGYFFCFLEQDRYNDTLLLCAPDPAKISVLNDPNHPQQLRLIEQGQLVPLESRVEAIELVGGAFAATSSPQGFGNETATQFDLPPSEIAVLTNSGVHVIQRRRLVDIFDAILRFGAPGTGVDAEVKKFFDTYGRAEGCAAALAVACGAGTNDSANQATRISDPEVVELARKYFIELGGKPFADGYWGDGGNLPHIDQIHPSGRAEGLIFYTARIVRSIWRSSIIKPKAVAGSVTYSSSVDIAKLKSIQTQLINLLSFLKDNKNYISGLAGPQNLFTSGNKVDEVANQSEHRTLHAMLTLIESMIEGISFVLCLMEDKLDDIILSLPEQQQRAVKELTYAALFSSTAGQDLAKELVTAIVNRHIATGSNVDAVADALRRRCGSFCSADDVVMFKAIEFVRRAKDEADPETRNRQLKESLRLFEETAGSLTMENLADTVAEYRGLNFHQGAVQLALTVARQIDRGDSAVAFLDEAPSDDNHSPAAELFRKRQECYQLIFQVLDDLESITQNSPEMVNGLLSEAARICNDTWLTLYSSTDILFHYSLYDWLFFRNQADRLLEVDSPHVLAYLKHRSHDSVKHCDFTWKYLRRQDNLLDAAETLQDLALSENFDLPLADRLQYLSQASLICQTPGHYGAKQQMNQVGQAIQEQIDVASIQQDILERIRGDARISAEKKAKLVAALDHTLLPLTELYNMYADPYGYMDICLSIFQSADHRGLTEIRTCWEQLISEIHQKALSSTSPNITDHPYELIANEIRRLGKRFTNSEYIFPPSELILLLEKYDQEFQKDVAPQGWVVKTMVDAGVKEETVLAVLEEMFHRDEPPFRGQARKRLLADAMICVDTWWAKILRGQRGREGFRELEVVNTLRSMASLVLARGGEEWEAVERLCSSIERGGLDRRSY
ncbi:nucleoporin-domain-containing protein [Ascodesmis nigricans]|uniref:Nucleoporin-domain-containing protein n=1 Tax=Ascodesmis nigricans TaxID=341454 RepID=A0A4S2N3J0_9PEZI|nr:nucleoporin-domain-containing protein [Ascodesmis nigricans]